MGLQFSDPIVSVADKSDAGVPAWIGESAGLVGMLAALLVCVLAYSAWPRPVIWGVAALAIVGNLLYIVQIFMRRAAGLNAYTWRELLLATIVPCVALLVTIVMVGEVSGLLHLPFAGADRQPPKHVIHVSPDQVKGSD